MSNNVPSVVGLRLDRARTTLTEAGGQIVQITTTGLASAGQQVPDGSWRVVQQRPVDEAKVRLVVVREIQLEPNNLSAPNPEMSTGAAAKER